MLPAFACSKPWNGGKAFSCSFLRGWNPSFRTQSFSIVLVFVRNACLLSLRLSVQDNSSTSKGLENLLKSPRILAKNGKKIICRTALESCRMVRNDRKLRGKFYEWSREKYTLIYLKFLLDTIGTVNKHPRRSINGCESNKIFCS